MAAVSCLHELLADIARACFTAKRIAEDCLFIHCSFAGEQRSVLRAIR